jgi:pre-mRNA-splicing factor 18
MDVLKKELWRKREAFEQEFGGRKFVRRSEIEQRALEKKRELQKKSIRKRVAGVVGDDYDIRANSSDASSLPGAASKTKASSLWPGRM